MLICDIGNTNVSFYEDGKIWKKNIEDFYKFQYNEKVYYICVNQQIKDYLSSKKNYIDLEPYVEFDTIYKGIGIDRIAACRAVNDGVVVDAGSAITVDIMSNGTHLGGFILPGLQAYLFAYKNISAILDLQLNSNISLDTLPQNTKDAISYATIKSIILLIAECSKNKKIFFTGGDGQFLTKFFKNSIHDKLLVFKGLQDAVKKINGDM